jgi:hypothetical protein
MRVKKRSENHPRFHLAQSTDQISGIISAVKPKPFTKMDW